MPAMVALKCNILLKVLGMRLKGEGLAPKAMISASMHKLIRFIYGVLMTRVMFNAQLLRSLDFQDGI